MLCVSDFIAPNIMNKFKTPLSEAQVQNVPQNTAVQVSRVEKSVEHEKF